MQQKIEENRKNFRNQTCTRSITLGAASYFFIKQGKAQDVWGGSKDGRRGKERDIHLGS